MHTYLCSVSHASHSLLAAIFYPRIPTPSWVLSLFPPGFSPAKPKHSFSSETKTLSLSGFSLLCLYPAQPRVLPSGYYCNTPLVFLLLPGPCPWTLKSCSSPGLPTSRSLSLQTNLHRGVCISASFWWLSSHQVQTDQWTVFSSWILATPGFTGPPLALPCLLWGQNMSSATLPHLSGVLRRAGADRCTQSATHTSTHPLCKAANGRIGTQSANWDPVMFFFTKNTPQKLT